MILELFDQLVLAAILVLAHRPACSAERGWARHVLRCRSCAPGDMFDEEHAARYTAMPEGEVN